MGRSCDGSRINRKDPSQGWVFSIEYFKLALTYSPSGEVPSAQRSLTAVFGMGTGVPFSQKHQLKIFNFQIYSFACREMIPTKVGVGAVGFEPTTSCVHRRALPVFELRPLETLHGTQQSHIHLFIRHSQHFTSKIETATNSIPHGNYVQLVHLGLVHYCTYT